MTLVLPSTLATSAVLLLAVALGPERVEAEPARTTTPRARRLRDAPPRHPSQRTVDRVITRRVRDAIGADPFLARAVPAVKVTTNRGVVRLRGEVRTDKERSSIAFVARQVAGIERVDDRLTIGNHSKGSAW